MVGIKKRFFLILGFLGIAGSLQACFCGLDVYICNFIENSHVLAEYVEEQLKADKDGCYGNILEFMTDSQIMGVTRRLARLNYECLDVVTPDQKSFNDLVRAFQKKVAFHCCSKEFHFFSLPEKSFYDNIIFRFSSEMLSDDDMKKLLIKFHTMLKPGGRLMYINYSTDSSSKKDLHVRHSTMEGEYTWSSGQWLDDYFSPEIGRQISDIWGINSPFICQKKGVTYRGSVQVFVATFEKKSRDERGTKKSV